MRSTLTAAGLLGFVVVLALSSPPLRGAEPNPKNTLQQARAAVKGHHLPEAIQAYETIVADPSRNAAKYKADALYELLLLRVSADPAARDLPRGAAAIEGLRAYPTYPRAPEVAAIGDLLQEMDRRAAEEKRAREVADKRQADTTARMNAAVARANSLAAPGPQQPPAAKPPQDDPAKLRQEMTGMRAEIRNLRDQLAKTQAELQKKDEALKKVAGSLMKPR